MAKIIDYNEILSILRGVDAISAMEEGFIEYSNGNSVIPPVGSYFSTRQIKIPEDFQ